MVDKHCSVRLHSIHVHEDLHCMYIVYAIPSLNKDIIIIIIIIIIILLLSSVQGEPRSHHLTVTHPSTSWAQRCLTCLSKSSH